ncbi:hypothetical protein [Streptomyces californicus]|uniref:hypothetical protein n=1 Tax=Streptomyces californicus TaxID=67351 RepID=UPI00379DE27B
MRRRVITIVMALFNHADDCAALAVAGTACHSFNASSTVPAPIWVRAVWKAADA